MNIKFNGKFIEVLGVVSLADILTEQAVLHGFNLDACVAAINLQFIHQDGYAQYEVKEGDDIELLTAVVGG